MTVTITILGECIVPPPVVIIPCAVNARPCQLYCFPEEYYPSLRLSRGISGFAAPWWSSDEERFPL